ncbi:hypothetical protein LAJ19_09555 [Deinococcus taeanensis]|uniref:hypothetical protein n=1 Tax=Deinococcus taeanensis TaxID=2737050 RepID=UPI001CDD70A6|nr:hypothetical protein [Deinococcus taeanensis]UBV41889.1 hypothetical protein LAJ19_09555 [Deinococcus taeanensis]
MLPRPSAPASLITLCALSGVAGAADYSKTVWGLVSGQVKVPAQMETNVMGELVMRLWARPPGVPADALMFIYTPKVSTNHWALMLVNPDGKAGEFVGARNLAFLKAARSRDGQSANLYQLADGMFKGLYLMDT